MENMLSNNQRGYIQEMIQKGYEASLRRQYKTEAQENVEKYTELLVSHNIPEQYFLAKFTDYNFAKKSVIAGYLRNIKANTQAGIGIFLNGDVGTGKTRFAYAFLKKYIWEYINLKNSSEVCYVSFHKLQKSIIEAEKQDQDNVRKGYAGYKLLIIDEFAVKALTDSQVDNLLEILNIRSHNKPCGKPTIIISNQNLETIRESTTDAIYSRINGNMIQHEMISDDRRTIKNRLILD